MKKTAQTVVGFVLFLVTVHAVRAAVSINEFIPHTSEEWVELYNSSDSAEYIRQYFIDDDTSFADDAGSSPRKPLTGLHTENTGFPYIVLGSSVFNNSGDSVVLFDESGIILDQYIFTDDPGEDVPIGRSPDNTGPFGLLSAVTRGSPNAAPPSLTPTTVVTHTASPTPIATKSPTPTAGATQTPTAVPAAVINRVSTVLPSAPSRISPKLTDILLHSSVSGYPVLGVSDVRRHPVSTPSAGPDYSIQISALLIGSGLSLLSGVLFWRNNHRKTQTTAASKRDILIP